VRQNNLYATLIELISADNNNYYFDIVITLVIMLLFLNFFQEWWLCTWLGYLWQGGATILWPCCWWQLST